MRKSRVNTTDIIGKRYSLLVALKFDKRIDSDTYWLCRCDCGNIKSIKRSCLRKGRSKSCGCLQREHAFKGGNYSCVSELIARYKGVGKQRKREYNLTREKFIELTSSNCHYCNSPPSRKVYPRNNKTKCYIFNGLDRVDNNLGYIESNVVPCCVFCNYAKHTRTYEEFNSWIDGLVEFRCQKK